MELISKGSNKKAFLTYSAQLEKEFSKLDYTHTITSCNSTSDLAPTLNSLDLVSKWDTPVKLHNQSVLKLNF